MYAHMCEYIFVLVMAAATLPDSTLENSPYWVPLQLGQASGHHRPLASGPGSILSATRESQQLMEICEERKL